MEHCFAEWARLLTFMPTLQGIDLTARQGLSQAWATRHGQFSQWLSIVDELKSVLPSVIEKRYDTAAVSAIATVNRETKHTIEAKLKALMPWRKGPFHLCGVDVDCEWRSDWKYQRVQQTGMEWREKNVLDVGTGSGYFLYRLLGDNARIAVGLDPSWHYFAQFLCLQQFFHELKAIYLPATLEQIPLQRFDATICMGVLYHRRDPLAFLAQLRETLNAGGELLLETLVVDGNEYHVYLPEARYAGMRNVWFLPSTAALARWLKRLNFDVQYIGEAIETTVEEQRRTDWMQSYSLAEFLSESSPNDPLPKRAIVIAKRK
ncbi:tRNA 5-methoxyuridine(34)/uridine 5-oxyacetic acid(34) synthase CmoB [Suttonella ornithocola]|uniref:tRNA (Mo5U34)-methyltransferase n=1 Tax=Suttonella ornithocola TaxID=279832 RepID=A0A380MRK5_9GAMM|nr:tRNA 5-methoxyuridine(34)/uridine 5-oxyacetic acid(34) synthase CmoB [Suttonella ornithocola]SUO94341.1 tRNA (mo5U34)-methyltransferase [Suttonella ornithocola]